MPRPSRDLSGARIGWLRIDKVAEKTGPQGERYWVCLCDCGKEIVRSAATLLARPHARASCGCRMSVIQKERRTHTMARTRPHGVWTNMLSRCRNPKSTPYARYGGRGIKVCAEWESFTAFWADMGPSYQDGLTIEREDNDGDYCKENCRWATKKEQARNRCSSALISTEFGRVSIAEAAERAGLKYGTVQQRIAKGWPEDQLLSPLRRISAKKPSTTVLTPDQLENTFAQR